MSAPSQDDTILRVSSLRQTSDTRFKLEPDAAARAALAQDVGADAVRKIRFDGVLTPRGRAGFTLTAKLGATVVQPCIVTLEPVTTRIDTEVIRHFVPEERMDRYDEGSETEMSEEDEQTDVLGEVIDLSEVMAEALSLAMPTYPRKDGAELEGAQFAAEGIAPMQDEDTKPFAGLAALREKMQKDGGED
ncbi:YceD family protein [Tropicibacter naphthalenivorans]|uniref:DUF177 domain-containing protein n=1 Tax=Tropicibacter naphthalenivorans TaxID=441103 RepID=A0A0P1G686_9RHOB|nr:DUF177 domain-containing protein [Tropicibacter naphthalenivorans]CUH77252.1 hypothetical protein TRN7648_01372 [Tropicibacter naphthalenivorans]SMC59566.1 Uncharacterized metal-binding protein YceD, DUF177 family [Tropicibacter naphthalenivorans]